MIYSAPLENSHKEILDVFHCNAKPLALGPRLGLDPKHNEFALRIPSCWYLKSLVDPTQPPQHEPIMPNVSWWNIGCVGSPRVGARIGHVDFMLFVSISFALGSQRKRGFQWNMGLTPHAPFVVNIGLTTRPQVETWSCQAPCIVP